MRKLIPLGAAAFLISVIGGAQATPLSAAGVGANRAIEQALPDQARPRPGTADAIIAITAGTAAITTAGGIATRATTPTGTGTDASAI